MKYAVYAACPLSGDIFFGYTHDICLDISFYKYKGDNVKIIALTDYIPIDYAYYIYNQLNTPSLIDRFVFGRKDKLGAAIKKAGRLVKILGVKTGEPVIYKKNDKYRFDDVRIYELIKGRAYLADEIKYLTKLNDKTLYDMLQIYKLKGLLYLMPAVELKEEGTYACLRCGSNNITKFRCLSCMEKCAYCEDCLNMGRTTACRVFVECPDTRDREKPFRDIRLNMDFDLTEAQKDASDDAVRFVSGTKKKALIWAACGAGKTEVVFEAIRKVLSWGNKVLYAVPRRDVVIELGQRFKKAFPDENISVLYGGSEKNRADFTIATTHQALRFYKTFDLTIIDEYDAFPYNGSDMLERAVKRSMKDDGRVIYMTATPTKKLYTDYMEKTIEGIIIPARHHHHPLPVPEIIKLYFNDTDLKLPKKITLIIKELIRESKKVIIYVPYIAMTAKICAMLKNDGIKADFIHSKDPKRDMKKAMLIGGRIDVLVSTTVLERGITIENVQVLIFFADHHTIFDESTLIQMAGRVGRTAKYYDGKVFYVAGSISDEMEGSINKIRMMNKIAKKKKYVY